MYFCAKVTDERTMLELSSLGIDANEVELMKWFDILDRCARGAAQCIRARNERSIRWCRTRCMGPPVYKDLRCILKECSAILKGFWSHFKGLLCICKGL